MGLEGLSLGHMLVVLLVVMLVFGTKKLRSIGSDLGAAIRDFRRAMTSTEEPGTAPPPDPGRAPPAIAEPAAPLQTSRPATSEAPQQPRSS